jgi:hypothetical protein
VVYLSYRPHQEEAGPEKTFDLSGATISERWAAGRADMDLGLKRIKEGEQTAPITEIRRSSTLPQGQEKQAV